MRRVLIVFDASGAWELDPRVAVRPEPFGALLYHFGTRKLSFLKNTTVVEVVRSLADHPSADAAIAAVVADPAARAPYVQALSTLAGSAMIRPAAHDLPETA
ncbi:mycofactocin biosynthesis chaperone MftB [uncultured Williamsia sp.]|uniref:mycofactocin biosynthesis chaperone MftB n=1 Tax=uncultured Williamsia sp. TaxID=259311 RepID=UPI0026088D35|nr:mycofactocin biosynthesis chaperone MftB [uncultured Williamsia sp.]